MKRDGVVRRGVAEVLTIVLGVLLAFWVESWREGRHDQTLGTSYLERLLTDVRADSSRFARVRYFHGRYREASEALLHVLEVAPSRIEDPVEVAHLLAQAGYLNPDNTATSTYDDLVSSGRLSLIEDLETRSSIQLYYADLTRRIASLESAPSGLQGLARQWLPGVFAREAQQCMWMEWDRITGVSTPSNEECRPEIAGEEAAAVVTRLQGRREAVRDLLNEVIWYSRDIEFKFSVQETKRSSLQHLLEGAIQH